MDKQGSSWQPRLAWERTGESEYSTTAVEPGLRVSKRPDGSYWLRVGTEEDANLQTGFRAEDCHFLVEAERRADVLIQALKTPTSQNAKRAGRGKKRSTRKQRQAARAQVRGQGPGSEQEPR